MTAAARRATLYVVLSTQRSGSNWLEDRLDGHPDVTMARGEVFRATLHDGAGYYDFRAGTGARRACGIVAPALLKDRYVDHLVSRASTPVIGFRLMYDQLRRHPSLRLVLARHRTRFVHLIRHNVLATHVSVLAARQSGLFLTRSTDKRSPDVEVPTEGLVQVLQRRNALVERHRRWLARRHHLEIGYEDYVAAPAVYDDRVLRFLGVSPARSLVTALQQVGAVRPGDAIRNIDEVAATLRSTPFEAML